MTLKFWLRKWLAIARKTSFVVLLASILCLKLFRINVPKILLILYPIFLALSFIYYLLYSRKHTSSISAVFSGFIEMILISDAPSWLDTRRAARPWNIWHFRNYDRQVHNRRNKDWAKVYLIKLVIFLVLAVTLWGITIFASY